MPEFLLHHSETVDPTLVRWMRDLFGHLFETRAWPVIVVLGAVIAVMPLWLISATMRRRRQDGMDLEATD